MEIVVLVVLIGGMGLALWWLARRRREILGDPDSTPGEREPEPTEVFTRDALVNRPRGFDPGRWDDTQDAQPPAPSPSAEPEDGELPTYFDREYLQRRSQPATPPEAGPPVIPPAAAPPLATPRADADPLPPWPTTPTEPDPEQDLPRYFDREYLERKATRNQSDPPAQDA